MEQLVYLDGQFVPPGSAKISIFDRGLLFADAVYEVVAVIDGRLVDFDRHIARMDRSRAALKMTETIPDREGWIGICRHLVTENGVKDGMVYMQVSRGNAGARSFYFPAAGTPPTVIAFTQSFDLTANPAAETGISVISVPDLRWSRCDIKTTQLLYASLMKEEARERGADDAWLIRDGFVGEGTSQNAHIVTMDGRLVTRPLDNLILHGATRAALIDLAEDIGIMVEERPFTLAEAMAAGEAFVSAATALVLPVTRIDGMPVGDGRPGPVTARLREAYIAWARETAI